MLQVLVPNLLLLVLILWWERPNPHPDVKFVRPSNLPGEEGSPRRLWRTRLVLEASATVALRQAGTVVTALGLLGAAGAVVAAIGLVAVGNDDHPKPFENHAVIVGLAVVVVAFIIGFMVVVGLIVETVRHRRMRAGLIARRSAGLWYLVQYQEGGNPAPQDEIDRWGKEVEAFLKKYDPGEGWGTRYMVGPAEWLIPTPVTFPDGSDFDSVGRLNRQVVRLGEFLTETRR